MPAPPFESTVETIGAAAVIRLVGRLDGATAPQFETSVNEAASGSPKRFVLEMGKVGFMSSAALRVVIVLIKKSKELGAPIVVANASPEILEIFRISGFQSMIKSAPTLEDALK